MQSPKPKIPNPKFHNLSPYCAVKHCGPHPRSWENIRPLPDHVCLSRRGVLLRQHPVSQTTFAKNRTRSYNGGCSSSSDHVNVDFLCDSTPQTKTRNRNTSANLQTLANLHRKALLAVENHPLISVVTAAPHPKSKAKTRSENTEF